MKKSIDIDYVSSAGHVKNRIPIFYELSLGDDVLTLYCYIDLHTPQPSWMQMRKFQVKSQLVGAGYETLYNPDNDIKNVDCALFIDKAYADIMHKEQIALHMDTIPV